MKEHEYKPDLPHGLPLPSYLKVSKYGIANLWTEEMGQFDDPPVSPYGSLNQDGLELLERARDKGWDHRGFFYYKNLGINWFTPESIDSLIDFTEIEPVKEGEVFAQPDITSTYVRPWRQTEDIYQPINRHGTRLLGDDKSPAIIKTLWDSSMSIDYDLSVLRWNPRGIPGLLTSSEVSRMFNSEGVTRYESPMEILQILNESALQQVLEDEFFTDEIKSFFMEMLIERGLFIGSWAEKYFNRRLVRSLADLKLPANDLKTLYISAYGDNSERGPISNLADEQIFEMIAGHIFWQMIFYSVQNEPIRDQLQNWVRVYSEPRNCAMCHKSFSPILIRPEHYFGSNGNTSICFGCIEPTSPEIAELKPLIIKFVETCGFPPPDGVTPIDWRVNIKIPHEQQLNVIKAWSDMGGIHHVKNSLQVSWFKAMYDAGCLPEGTVPTGRGIKCVATDGHECGSLDEKTIDDFLSSHSIEHEKEPYYPSHSVLNPGKKRRADWRVGDIFVEYFGLAGNTTYDQKTSEKLRLAAECSLELVALFPEDVIDLDNALLKNLEL